VSENCLSKMVEVQLILIPTKAVIPGPFFNYLALIGFHSKM